jgi:hypothetical protein
MSSTNRLGRLGLAAILAAGIAFAVVQLARPHGHGTVRGGSLAAQGPARPTVSTPLLYGPAEKTTMATAVCTLGVSVPSPNTPDVQPADAGAVWRMSLRNERWMAVTFPSHDLYITYHRPSVLPDDPTKSFQGDAAALQSARVVELKGMTPALEIDQNSDVTGSNYGSVEFLAKGTEVRVMGHADAATLEAIAQSILAGWPSTNAVDPQCSSPIGPTGSSGPTPSKP